LLGEKWSTLYPAQTGDPGRDRDARTLQFTCFVLASAVGTVAVLNTFQSESGETPIQVFAVVGLLAAVAMNRAGRLAWAGRTAFLAMLLTTTLLVFDARDGLRSIAMLLFPGMLFVSVMLVDRASYLTTGAIIMVTVAVLGIAEMHGLTRAVPHVRTATGYGSIFNIDLVFVVFALIGSRIARDRQSNTTDLRSTINELTAANHALRESAEALRESEGRFRNMADTAPVMIWVSGPDKERTFFNKPWLDFRSRTIDAEMGHGWAEGVHPDDIDRRNATYGSSFDARSGFEMEYRLRRFDGKYRWLLDTGVPRYGRDEFIGYIGSCIDVTERKEMEEQLRAKEARLLDAERLARVGSWELDPDTGGLLWSEEMFRIFGVPNGVMPNFDTFLDRVHRKDRQRIVDSRETAIESAEPIKLEFRIVRPDGSTRFVRSIVETIKNDFDQPLRFLGATQDVTEQVLANQTLRESEERLRNAERISHVGHWSWDIKTNHLLWSDEVFRIFGQPKDFKPSFDAYIESVQPPDRDRVGQWVSDGLVEKRGGAIEHEITRPNGDRRTVAYTSELLLDDEGLPARLFGTCQDVTDIRREQKESFARQKLESVGTLASGIAHDFNNLLGGVLGQVELALVELETGSAPVHELKTIREVALRGAEIVRQLMIYAGKESEKTGPIDLSQTVAEMVALLKVSVSKRAQLITDLGQNLPSLQADAAQIRRIVLNLVTNASQAIGDRDGVIRVSTRRVAAAVAAQLARDSAQLDYLELEISDNGCGMSQELQSKVFDLFFTTGSAGHGLGLAVVQGIVRNLGGIIHLESEVDKGATFRILIPCAPTVAEFTTRSRSNAQELVPQWLTPTVLVVEDEEALRQAVVKRLRGLGAEVLEAGNGTDAINLLRVKGSQIDAMLLDMTIPGSPSREVLGEAQSWPELKVILTSAYGEEMVAASMASSSVRCFIRKPFSLANLVEVLRDVLPS
jgi:PAS domain S-box-containing protein